MVSTKGYIVIFDGVGKTLVQFFNRYDDVQELIDLGDLSVVCNATNLDEVQAYHRDMGEELQPARIYDTYEEVLERVCQGCNYLFEDGEWFYSGYEGKIKITEKFKEINHIRL